MGGRFEVQAASGFDHKTGHSTFQQAGEQFDLRDVLTICRRSECRGAYEAHHLGLPWGVGLEGRWLVDAAPLLERVQGALLIVVGA